MRLIFFIGELCCSFLIGLAVFASLVMRILDCWRGVPYIVLVHTVACIKAAYIDGGLLVWAGDLVVVILVLCVHFHLFVLIRIVAIMIVQKRRIVVSTAQDVVDILVSLRISFGIRQEEVLVADGEAGVNVPAANYHIFDDVEICSYELRLAITCVLDTMAYNIVECLPQEDLIICEIRDHEYGLED